MSRRKQANPAKLGDEDCVELINGTSRADENSGTPLRIRTSAATGSENMQYRVCTRHIRSHSSSPPPMKVDRPDIHTSYSDGETSRFEDKFECGVCCLKFPRSSALDEHLQDHTDQLHFTCSYCPRLFKHKRSRDRHTKLHTGDKKYKCEQCASAFSRSDHLKIHMRTHDSRKPYKCGTCNRGYNTVAALSSHQQNHIKTESCSGSRTSRSTPSPSVDSSTKQDDLSGGSPEMDEGFRNPYFRCTYCAGTFSTLFQLHHHIRDMHGQFRPNMFDFMASSARCFSRDQQTSPNCFPYTYYGTNIGCPYESPPLYSSLFPDVRAAQEENTFQQTATDLSKKNEVANYETPTKRRKIGHPAPSPTYGPAFDRIQTCICPTCNIHLPNLHGFICHMESHIVEHNNRRFNNCPTCGESTPDFGSFLSHMFKHTIIPVSGDFCNICKLKFDSHSAHLKHYQEAHVMSLYKCTVCGKSFNNGDDLQPNPPGQIQVLPSTSSQKTNEEQHPECAFLYPCPFCSVRFTDESRRIAHVAKHHGKRLDEQEKENKNSHQILKPSITPSFLVLAMEPPEKSNSSKVPPKKTYSCDVCNLSDMLSEADLISHRKLQHVKTKVRSVSLQCAYCNETCKSRNDLENHMKSHQIISGKGKHKCNICDAMFTSFPLLADHKLSHCKIIDGNTCVQCKASLTDITLFYNHQMAHSNSPVKSNSQIFLPANCVICCQTLQNDIELKLHANFHLKHLVKKFLCTICNENFESMDPENLNSANFVGVCQKCSNESDANIPKFENIDMRKEKLSSSKCLIYFLNEKNNLECRLCKQFYPNALKLQLHLIEHNYHGMNQYRCYVCSAVFTGAIGLRNHILGHGLHNRPYECEFCQIKFFFRAELDNHIILHNSPQKNGTPNHSIDGSASIHLQDANNCETCPYCHNIFLNSSHFNEHVKFCSSVSERKTNSVKVAKIDNNIKREENDYA